MRGLGKLLIVRSTKVIFIGMIWRRYIVKKYGLIPTNYSASAGKASKQAIPTQQDPVWPVTETVFSSSFSTVLPVKPVLMTPLTFGSGITTLTPNKNEDAHALIVIDMICML